MAMKTWSDRISKKMSVAEAMSMTESGAALLWLEETRDVAYRNLVLAALFETSPELFPPANELPC
jgi:hypothetical protein